MFNGFFTRPSIGHLPTKMFHPYSFFGSPGHLLIYSQFPSSITYLTEVKAGFPGVRLYQLRLGAVNGIAFGFWVTTKLKSFVGVHDFVVSKNQPSKWIKSAVEKKFTVDKLSVYELPNEALWLSFQTESELLSRVEVA